MIEPTPIRKRRPKAEKLAAVLAAEMVGVTEVERQTGIPHQTIGYWMDQPEFSQYRRKAREDLVAEVTLVAHLAWHRVAEGLASGAFEPRDILFAAEKSSGLMQLLTGQATERIETVTAGLNDHERALLRDVLKQAIAEREAVDAGV